MTFIQRKKQKKKAIFFFLLAAKLGVKTIKYKIKKIDTYYEKDDM
jgi:uracil phosphoribosyltransferase